MINYNNIANRPDVTVRVTQSKPAVHEISSHLMTVKLIEHDDQGPQLDSVYINYQKFNVKDKSQEGFEKLFGSYEDIIGQIETTPVSRRAGGRKTRKHIQPVMFEQLQPAAEADIAHSGLTRENVTSSLSGLLTGRNVSITDIETELSSFKVANHDLAHFLVYESQYRKEIVSAIYGGTFGQTEIEYNFQPLTPDESFAYRIAERIGQPAEYDKEKFTMRIGERLITNVPHVDENGVFHSTNTSYIPHYVGYFSDTPEDNGKSRAERFRVFDMVKSAVDKTALAFAVTNGELRAPSILDCTRITEDNMEYTYRDEVFRTLKGQITYKKSLAEAHSMSNVDNRPGLSKAKREKMTQEELDAYDRDRELGVIKMMMRDEEMLYKIDPILTSNGGNMGNIMYLADGATIDENGQIVPGHDVYAPITQVAIDELYSGYNPSIRIKQAAKNMLTATKDAKVNIAFMEFGFQNVEDQMIVTKSFNELFDAHLGDKFDTAHGTKGVTGYRVYDPDMSDEEAEALGIPKWALETFRMNPDLQVVMSPMSLTSRMNIGIVHEMVNSERKELYLPDGSVVENGIGQMTFFKLPQTSAKKSKNYALEGSGRKFGLSYAAALGSKVGFDLYEKAMTDPEQKAENAERINQVANRCGLSFKDDSKFFAEGNVQKFVDAPVTVDMMNYHMMTPSAIRLDLQELLSTHGSVNILLPKDAHVINPFTQEPIVDSEGNNIIPLRQSPGDTLSFRYTEVFAHIGSGNIRPYKDKEGVERQAGLTVAYNALIQQEFNSIMRKDNILKNQDARIVKDGARTVTVVADPTLEIGQIRADAPTGRYMLHRDPNIGSSNILAMENIGGGTENTIYVHPIIVNLMQMDFDSDTAALLSFDQLFIGIEDGPEKDALKEQYFQLAQVKQEINLNGHVNLNFDTHWNAMVKTLGIDESNLTLDGRTVDDVVDNVHTHFQTIINDPRSYGAYAIDFTSLETAKQGMQRIANDGVKGNAQRIEEVFQHGYTKKEHDSFFEAEIAKTEKVGEAGAITNGVVTRLYGGPHADILRDIMNMTATRTHAVLQMKHNVDKKTEILQGISMMRNIFKGQYDYDDSRALLHDLLKDTPIESGIDPFMEKVSKLQSELVTDGKDYVFGKRLFGYGVFNHTEINTLDLAFATQNEKRMKDVLEKMYVDNTDEMNNLTDNTQIML